MKPEIEDVSPQKKEVEKQTEDKRNVLGNQLHQIKTALGSELFQKVYEFLKYHRRRGTDEAHMHSEIKKMVYGDKRLLNYCFNLDGIVFMELL